MCTTRSKLFGAGITAIEMAERRPPHADLHPMRVLFVIPKAEQPALEGKWSSSFKDFVKCCTMKDPLQRQSAATLLKHPFVKVYQAKDIKKKNYCNVQFYCNVSIIARVFSS